MSESISQFPAIIQAINGPTGLIALLALLIFGIAVLMFGKEGTKVKIFIFISLLLIMVFAIIASVSYEQEKDWANSTDLPVPQVVAQDPVPQPQAKPQPSAQPVQQAVANNGFASGTVIQQCGCWGYVDFGATDLAPTCASGFAQAVGCPAYCPAGGYQWMVQCL